MYIVHKQRCNRLFSTVVVHQQISMRIHVVRRSLHVEPRKTSMHSTNTLIKQLLIPSSAPCTTNRCWVTALMVPSLTLPVEAANEADKRFFIPGKFGMNQIYLTRPIGPLFFARNTDWRCVGNCGCDGPIRPTLACIW